MRSEQIKGAMGTAAGKAQGAVGELLDDQQMRLEGAARQAAGQLQETYGEVLDNVSRFVRDKPLASVAILAGIGLLAGLLWRRR
ncbi:ElaB protein [Pseudomonas chlororaphis]|uniref:CsbD family protein n=1 Tax=Pseudomonas chlororaphis subsp. aurantiaca TaxID=86192 RepID=A0AAJ0ZGM5_9PSED|nr:CsbD family protein [Pseudomonas chlororaphis]MBU4632222.1 CsbD family protein [Pseudomonas chlororaphis subsp. aurantiaca]